MCSVCLAFLCTYHSGFLSELLFSSSLRQISDDGGSSNHRSNVNCLRWKSSRRTCKPLSTYRVTLPASCRVHTADRTQCPLAKSPNCSSRFRYRLLPLLRLPLIHSGPVFPETCPRAHIHPNSTPRPEGRRLGTRPCCRTNSPFLPIQTYRTPFLCAGTQAGKKRGHRHCAFCAY